MGFSNIFQVVTEFPQYQAIFQLIMGYFKNRHVNFQNSDSLKHYVKSKGTRNKLFCAFKAKHLIHLENLLVPLTIASRKQERRPTVPPRAHHGERDAQTFYCSELGVSCRGKATLLEVQCG